VKPSFTGIVLEELANFLRERGAASYRAKQITDWIHKKRVASFDAMTDLPNESRAQFAAEFSYHLKQKSRRGIHAPGGFCYR
jgi:23S rRNA (adenine2503-C2)-methyltransferase